ncbi:MAG: nucleotidyl transferase AbiEii/AbiGii toxin family protein [Candidatus Marsarchaeota archaeon]|nr:nucleotidyl transferase AbiEii/AbiGii toxin family protein [Candidatus Marsarchaeota archaeon]
MIPVAYITEWQQTAPWQHPDMVEQDLVISRALVELFNDDGVARHLAFRGGTALYKLSLIPAARYSEDIDLVQIDAEPIGATIDCIHGILDPWLGKPRYDAKDRSYRLTYRFTSEAGTPLRLKVEINTREHVGNTVTTPFSVNCRWFSASTEITTFALPELLGTKLRALYQRKKGRDLFDLDYALRHSEIDGSEVTDFFVRYLAAEGNRVSTAEFLDNLGRKCEDDQFCQDMTPLLRSGITFTVDEAIERVSSAFIHRIDAAWERF